MALASYSTSGTPLRLIFILCLSLQHTQAIDDYYLDDYNYYEDYSDYSGPTAGMQWEKFSKEEGQIDFSLVSYLRPRVPLPKTTFLETFHFEFKSLPQSKNQLVYVR